MILDTVNTPFTKALLNGNSGAATFQTLMTVVGQTPDKVYNDGATGPSQTFNLSDAGLFQQNRLSLIPYADGPTGSVFSFRLYGWDIAFQGDIGKGIWVPFLLAEFSCTTSNITGIAGAPISATEHLADTITLTRGTTGTNGFAGGYVNSTGPGTDLVAYALVTLSACRYITFDFKKTNNVAMNLIWSRA